MSNITVKAKTKHGIIMVSHLTSDSTLNDLKVHLSKEAKIPVDCLQLLYGYPPTALTLDNSTTLEKANIKSGETLIVQQVEIPQTAGVAENKLYPHTLSKGNLSGPLIRKDVPADNSCLFTSVGFVLGGAVDTTCGKDMRKIIAQEVARDEETYSEAILGKPNDEYCAWIQKPDSWGGAIELAVLSFHYGIEIAVIDTLNGVINRFGEDKLYNMRVFIIFDGIHYDPVFREIYSEDSIQTIFDRDDLATLTEAQELATEAKLSRQYTDINKFTLKCLQCQTLLVGHVEAEQHAKQTGHANYGEIAK